MDAIPGANIDSDTGLTIFPNSSVHSMKPLDFKIGGRTFTLDATAQLLTAEQTRGWGKSGKRFGVVNALGHRSGRGLDFIIGKRFMERYYVVGHCSFAAEKQELISFDRFSTRTTIESDLLSREPWSTYDLSESISNSFLFRRNHTFSTTSAV